MKLNIPARIGADGACITRSSSTILEKRNVFLELNNSGGSKKKTCMFLPVVKKTFRGPWVLARFCGFYRVIGSYENPDQWVYR